MRALVGDIGGTNARFAIAEVGEGAPRLSDVVGLRCADYDTIDDALATYLEGRPRPGLAMIAVACPVNADAIRMTNHVWQFSQSAVARSIGIENFRFINDFEAISYALRHLDADGVAHIGAQAMDFRADGVAALVGPGTGLGVGAVVDGRVIASEGGHASFAPTDALEYQILGRLQARYGRVSYERVVSGAGIAAVYSAIADIEGKPVHLMRPSDITAAALAGDDPLAVRTLHVFCDALGGFAGDVALMFGADRVFIAGGIAPRFVPFIRDSGFRERFEDKGRFHAMLAAMPTAVIMEPHVGLLGAAASLEEMEQ